MKEYQLRVVKEKEELDNKRECLREFNKTEVFEKLPDAERLLLVKQLNIMDQYSDILQERINIFRDQELCCSKTCGCCRHSDT